MAYQDDVSPCPLFMSPCRYGLSSREIKFLEELKCPIPSPCLIDTTFNIDSDESSTDPFKQKPLERASFSGCGGACVIGICGGAIILVLFLVLMIQIFGVQFPWERSTVSKYTINKDNIDQFGDTAKPPMHLVTIKDLTLPPYPVRKSLSRDPHPRPLCDLKRLESTRAESALQPDANSSKLRDDKSPFPDDARNLPEDFDSEGALVPAGPADDTLPGYTTDIFCRSTSDFAINFHEDDTDSDVAKEASRSKVSKT